MKESTDPGADPKPSFDLDRLREQQVKAPTLQHGFPKVISSQAHLDILRNSIFHNIANVQNSASVIELCGSSLLSLLSSLELLYVDMMICIHLMGYSKYDQFNEFVGKAVRFGGNLFRFKKEDHQRAQEYICFLVNRIKEISDIIKSKRPKSDILNTTFEFREAVESATNNFNLVLNKIKKKKGTLVYVESIIRSSLKFELDPAQADSAIKFKTWLFNELNLDDIYGEEAYDLKYSVAQASYRLLTLKRLQEKITTLKTLEMDHTTDDAQFCDPQTLSCSPFYKAAVERTNVLRKALDTVSEECALVNTVASSHKLIVGAVARYKEQRKRVTSQLKAHLQTMKSRIESLSKEEEELRKSIEPNISALLASLSHHQTKCGTIFSDRFIHSASQLPEMQKQKALSFANSFKEVEKAASVLESDLHDLSYATVMILDGSSRQHAASEITELRAREIESLNRYAGDLNAIIETLKIGGIGDLKNALDQAADGIDSAVERYSAAYSAIADPVYDGPEAVEKVMAEIEELRVSLSKLSEDAGKLESELDLLQEAEFARKAATAVSENAAMSEPVRLVDRGVDTQIQRLLQKVMCPICEENRRDCIISTCGHPFCLRCIEREKFCPICHTKFTESDVKKFKMG